MLFRSSDGWFKSVATYNALLLRDEFYARFSDYAYMLIYQLDAFVFRDTLLEWASRGYDYVGAPWLPNNRNFFQRTMGKVLRKLRKKTNWKENEFHVSHSHMSYQVGNGGLSLRRVEKMREVTTKYAKLISHLPLHRRSSQEDVFFSLYIRKRAGISVPDWKEALHFSFENDPRGSFIRLGERLPFGCHYWPKPKYWNSFWHRYIPCEM